MTEKEKKISSIVIGIVLVVVIAVFLFNQYGGGDVIKASLNAENSAELNNINKKYNDVKKLEIKPIDQGKLDGLVDRSIPKKSAEQLPHGKRNPFESDN